jgi:hypothetical protein
MRFVSAPLTAFAAFVGFQTTAHATVHINIDLSSQRMHVSSDSGADYEWPVSTGRHGHATPTGVFHPQRLYTMVHSAKYDNAPMPHAIFFHGPYAIHGTDAVGHLGHVASHGCIRLAPGNAATLFSLVQAEGATIVIGGHSSGGEVASVNKHRAGHRLAAAQRHRFQERSMAYSERRQMRSLTEWAKNPLRNP